jgi:hypothetical protein
MGDVSQALGWYIGEVIKLPQSDISSAVRSREWFINLVKQEIRGRTGEPVLYPERNTLNFGSYFKGTKVAAVDEFDVLVILDSNHGVFSQNGIDIGSGLGRADPNHMFDEKYKKSDGIGVSPTKLLNWLKDVIESATGKYGVETPVRNGQAITATIKSKDLKLDLIPAGVFQHDVSGETFYNIPRGDQENGWILTTPHRDMERLKEVAHGRENFRNVIRLCKRIRDTYNFGVSSFAIESAVIGYAEMNSWYNDLYTDFRAVLKSLIKAFRSGKILDPFDNQNNLIAGIESLRWYADRLEKIIKGLDECADWEQDQVRERIYTILENQ